MSCPRPRLGRHGNTHNTPKYIKYKEQLVFLLKSQGIIKGNYSTVFVEFYFPYPKSTPKKNRIDNAPAFHTRYDLDNLIKGFFDSLQEAYVIENDRAICTTLASKIYTTQDRGRITFDLK
jgi:Holliday junction resolvase RusA-like endonuclease